MLYLFLSSFILGAVSYLFYKIDASILLAIYDKYYPNKKRLANSTVWIVGSSTGIGEALAYEFVKLNCKLILTSTTKSKLDEVKRKCLNLNSSSKDDDILVLPFDVSDLKANREALKIVLDKFGDIDILVGNAARAGVENSALDGTDDEMEIHRKIFDINYFANIYLAKLVASHWEKTKSKSLKILAVTSSIAAISSVVPHFHAYTASKKSLNDFYRDLKLQYPKIQVSNCMPGPVSTNIENNSLGKIKFTLGNQAKMTSERCAELFIIGISNRLNEFITCQGFWLIYGYLNIYFNFEMYSLLYFLNSASYFKHQFSQ